MQLTLSSKRIATTGFSLLELMAATAVLMILLLTLVKIVDSVSNTTSTSTAQIGQFTEARRGFESMTLRLAQATLSTYLECTPSNLKAAQLSVGQTTQRTEGPLIGNFTGGNYNAFARFSELRFICSSIDQLLIGSTPADPTLVRTSHGIFFQAPLGFSENDDAAFRDSQLNTWGYFIEYSSEDQTSFPRPLALRSPGSKPRYRYRLMELMEPSERLSIYQYTSGWLRWPGDTNLFDYGVTNADAYYTNPPLPGLTLPDSVRSSMNVAMPPSSYPSTSPLYNCNGKEWFQKTLEKRNGSNPSTPSNYKVIAENIIAMIIQPQLSQVDEDALKTAGTIPSSTPTGTALAPQYSYDTTADSINATTGTAAYKKAVNTLNQLPPVVKVTMVAIDEKSAARLQATSADPSQPPTIIQDQLNSLFDVSTTNSAEQFDADMKKLEDVLIANKINYRIITSSINIGSAKWSRD